MSARSSYTGLIMPSAVWLAALLAAFAAAYWRGIEADAILPLAIIAALPAIISLGLSPVLRREWAQLLVIFAWLSLAIIACVSIAFIPMAILFLCAPAAAAVFEKEKVVEAMLSVAHYVERNWDYKIISNDSGNYTIESKQSEQMLDHSPKKIYTNSYINEMRTYFFYYFMELCGFKNHDVQITSQEFNINSKMTFKVITRGASFTPQASSAPKFH